jgi:hypothetical protein
LASGAALIVHPASPVPYTVGNRLFPPIIAGDITFVTCPAISASAPIRGMTPMRRAVLVGIAAAFLALLLVSITTAVEVRYTRFGLFMRDTAVEMRSDHVSRTYSARYDDPIDFLGRWVRLNQMVVEPALFIVVGIFVGWFSRRVLVSSVLGVAPIVALNWLPDVLAALSIAICLTVCWSIAAGTRRRIERRAQTFITA